MSSDISFCIYCNKPIPKVQVACKECYEKELKQVIAFGTKYRTTP